MLYFFKRYSQQLAWTSCLLLVIALIFIHQKNSLLKNNLNNQVLTNELLEQQRALLQSNALDKDLRLNDLNNFVAFMTLNETTKIKLSSQNKATSGFVHLYLNKNYNYVYIDIINLTQAPKEKVYQLWSLSPKPICIGNLDIFKNHKRFVKLSNKNNSSSFVIKLERKINGKN